jgi:hypothetical protein
MPPPGVGKVITIEAPELESGSDRESEGDLENAKLSNERPPALEFRQQRDANSSAEAEPKEGQSLQYLPNWIRHLKQKEEDSSQ